MIRLALALVVAEAVGYAQPITKPADLPPLAEIRDDRQLAEALAQITQDPAIRVDDPKARARAQALMSEGVKQLQAKAYDQALANFLAAYAEFPSPKILIDIAATLRDMGRPADAANTYQRYLADPATGPERVAEVKQLLQDLDRQLTVLAIRVFPRASQVSIDGGPFVAVGSSMLTRVRPGLHLVRVRVHDASIDVSSEVTVNAFEGEVKDVPVVLQLDTSASAPPPPPPPPPPATAAPDKVGWLITGTQYSAPEAGNERERHVMTGAGGTAVTAVAPIVPRIDLEPELIVAPGEPEDHIGSGVLGVLRIDGHARGAAGGLGIAYAPNDAFELEVAILRSEFWGAYVGARYRFLTGLLRPYLGVGLPIFEFSATDSTTIAPGVRGAAGLELKINGHLSVQGDLGLEHFWNVDGVIYMQQYRIDADVFVPTLGIIGRM